MLLMSFTMSYFGNHCSAYASCMVEILRLEHPLRIHCASLLRCSSAFIRIGRPLPGHLVFLKSKIYGMT